MGPGLGLGGVGEEVHDDGGLANGLVNLEQVLAGDPAILKSLLPGLAALSDTDDDVQAVVTEVETLTVTLGTVADKGEGVVLEVAVELVTRPVGTFYSISMDTRIHIVQQ